MAESRLIRMSAPKRKTSTAVDDAPTVNSLTTLSPSTIYRKIKRGEFPAPTTIGGVRLWRESDVHDWINRLFSSRVEG